MAVITLARNAMATRFELVLHGENSAALRAAGEEAFDEIERLEAQLSLFRPTSEIAHLNARAAIEPVRVTPALFSLLQQAQKLSTETSGAFDITIAPLVRCWGFMAGTGKVPLSEDLEEARACVGMHLVHLNPTELTVRFARQGVMLDLGAIGKGYAVDRAVQVLRDAGVKNALLHGGTSTIYAIGTPADSTGWKVAIANPRNQQTPPRAAAVGDASEAISQDSPAFATVCLKDESLSVSAIWGKSFTSDGQVFGHIIDPRTGQPARASLLSAVTLPSATETDALSTALLTLGHEGYNRILPLRPGMRALIAAESDGQLLTYAYGFQL